MSADDIPVEFKVTSRGAPTRRLSFPTRPAWAELATTLAELYTLDVATLAVTYTDADGDEITASSDAELRLRYADLGDGDVIRLDVRTLSATEGPRGHHGRRERHSVTWPMHPPPHHGHSLLQRPPPPPPPPPPHARHHHGPPPHAPHHHGPPPSPPPPPRAVCSFSAGFPFDFTRPGPGFGPYGFPGAGGFFPGLTGPFGGHHPQAHPFGGLHGQRGHGHGHPHWRGHHFRHGNGHGHGHGHGRGRRGHHGSRSHSESPDSDTEPEVHEFPEPEATSAPACACAHSESPVLVG